MPLADAVANPIINDPFAAIPLCGRDASLRSA